MLKRDDKGRIIANAFTKDSTEMRSNEEASILLGRSILSGLVGQQFHGVRDIDAVCGYNTNPSVKDFQARYNRRGIASVIVDEPAKTAWRKSPIVTDGTTDSSFMKSWNTLSKRMNVYHYLERADRLSGIGYYGILLIGSKTGELNEPLTTVSGPSDIIFLSPFSQSHASIHTYETNTKNPRFGQPLMYRVAIGGDIISTRSVKTQDVRYSRVIHIAEGLLENEVMGEPRLKKVFNRLEDLDKIVGAAAEGFWQTAAPGYTIGPKKDYDLDATAIVAAKGEMQNYMHGLQRVIATEGIDINELGGKISDPESAFDVVMSLISGKTGIPKRVMTGSEQGELASSQDQANWLSRVASRQEQFVEPKILRAFIDRLISINALPMPNGKEYTIEWEDLFCLNELEQAKAHAMNAMAVKNMTNEGESEIVSDEEKRVFLGLPEVDDGN